MAPNIADLFEHAVDTFPDRLAVVCGDTELTYAELEARANRLAHYLSARGVGLDSHVGVYGHNSVTLVETLLATYKLRARAVNVNYRYVENELQYVLADGDVTALVHDRSFAPKVAGVLPELPGLREIVVIEDGSDADFSGYGGTAYEDALASASPERDFAPRSGEDVYLLYTGGTTGYPKGVMWRHADVWRTLGGGIDFMTGIPAEDEWAQSKRGVEMGFAMVRLCLAPFIHGNAQWAALMALFGGDTVVMMPRFDPEEVWRVVERRKVNVIVLIGDAMARPMIEALPRVNPDVSSVFAISSSAALFSPSVKEQYVATLPNVMITDSVGSSETGFTGMSMVTGGSGQTEGPRVTPGPNTIVIDEHGKRAAPGVVGRLARGGYVPIGYYKDPEKTAALFAEVDGVRYTVPGDFARIEEDGTITLLGRGTSCINTGGEKVFPEEVEGALKSHPDVFDALVIGLPDERLGQRVAAIVQPREGRTPDLAALEAHVREQIAGYKVPRTVLFVDEVGRTLTGKADYAWAHRVAQQAATI